MAKMRKRLNKVNHPTVDVKIQSLTFWKVLRQFLGKATRHLGLNALKEMLYSRASSHIARSLRIAEAVVPKERGHPRMQVRPQSID